MLHCPAPRILSASRRITSRSAPTAGARGRSLCLLKWLCLNGKNREGRSTLPGDPFPPPKRDGQAFAESAANVVDVAHRGRRCRANSQPRYRFVQYASIAPASDPSSRLLAVCKTPARDCRHCTFCVVSQQHQRTLFTCRCAQVRRTLHTHRSRKFRHICCSSRRYN